jgi:hypothetical protein
MEIMNVSELQIDHRIPFEIGGDRQTTELNPDDFMLLSGSANRAKSWSCEHCENWLTSRRKEICLSCYWAFPENYSHVALCEVRRVDLIWQGDEVNQFQQLSKEAKALGQTIPDFVKQIIEKANKPGNT